LNLSNEVFQKSLSLLIGNDASIEDFYELELFTDETVTNLNLLLESGSSEYSTIIKNILDLIYNSESAKEVFKYYLGGFDFSSYINSLEKTLLNPNINPFVNYISYSNIRGISECVEIEYDSEAGTSSGVYSSYEEIEEDFSSIINTSSIIQEKLNIVLNSEFYSSSAVIRNFVNNLLYDPLFILNFSENKAGMRTDDFALNILRKADKYFSPKIWSSSVKEEISKNAANKIINEDVGDFGSAINLALVDWDNNSRTSSKTAILENENFSVHLHYYASIAVFLRLESSLQYALEDSVKNMITEDCIFFKNFSQCCEDLRSLITVVKEELSKGMQ
jgi:hypothetical protein